MTKRRKDCTKSSEVLNRSRKTPKRVYYRNINYISIPTLLKNVINNLITMLLKYKYYSKRD